MLMLSYYMRDYGPRGKMTEFLDIPYFSEKKPKLFLQKILPYSNLASIQLFIHQHVIVEA